MFRKEALVMSTEELIRGAICEIPSEDRAELLSRVTGVNRTINGFQSKVTSLLKEKGFRYFVPRKFITKFKYAAKVYDPTRIDPYGPLYIGDIPDFAIRNLESAKECGIQLVTIHSNEPLPSIPMVQIDPVMVGWRVVHLHTKQDGSLRIYSAEEWESPYGVVLAVWNMDKEIVW